FLSISWHQDCPRPIRQVPQWEHLRQPAVLYLQLLRYHRRLSCLLQLWEHFLDSNISIMRKWQAWSIQIQPNHYKRRPGSKSTKGFTLPSTFILTGKVGRSASYGT